MRFYLLTPNVCAFHCGAPSEDACADTHHFPGPLGDGRLTVCGDNPQHYPYTRAGLRATHHDVHQRGSAYNTPWRDVTTLEWQLWNPAMNNRSDLFITTHFISFVLFFKMAQVNAMHYKMVSAGVVLVWIGKVSRYYWYSLFPLMPTVLVLCIWCIFLPPPLPKWREMWGTVLHIM